MQKEIKSLILRNPGLARDAVVLTSRHKYFALRCFQLIPPRASCPCRPGMSAEHSAQVVCASEPLANQYSPGMQQMTLT